MNKDAAIARLTEPLQALKPEDVTSIRYYVHSLLPLPYGHREATRINIDGKCTVTVSAGKGNARVTAKNTFSVEPRMVRLLFHAVLSYARLANDIDGPEDDCDSDLVLCTSKGNFRLPGDLSCYGKTMDGHIITFMEDYGLAPRKWCDQNCLTNSLRRPIITYIDEDSEMLWKETPDSSCFERVGYCSARDILGVVFRDSGEEYWYFEVEEGEWENFQSAESLGRYWRSNIRDFYDYRHITEEGRRKNKKSDSRALPVVEEYTNVRIKASGRIGEVIDIGLTGAGYNYTIELEDATGDPEFVTCIAGEFEIITEDEKKQEDREKEIREEKHKLTLAYLKQFRSTPKYNSLKYSEKEVLEKLRTAIATNTPINEEDTSEYFLRKLQEQT